MYLPLQKLEHANARSRVQLTKLLSLQHHVRMAAGGNVGTENSSRGISFFLAFDPWRACKCFPPGSARFFDAAESHGLLSSDEAALISHTLVKFGAEISRTYQGSFLPYFSDPRVSGILQYVDDLDHLSDSGLTIADSWVDRLVDAVPGPLIPQKHFQVQSFTPLNFAGEVSLYSGSPWLAWAEMLEFASLGPWYGFSAEEIIWIINALRRSINGTAFQRLNRSERILCRYVSIPIFSRGLQGFVAGIFFDVKKEQREGVLNALLQFGETMGDIYADLRRRHFFEALDGDPDDEQLARELVQFVSPVAKLIMKRGNRKTGYGLNYEQGYLAGYRPLTAAECDAPPAPQSFVISGPYRSEIYVEPICDLPSLNPEFARMRLESYLNHTLGSVVTRDDVVTLPYADVQQLRVQLEAYTDNRAASVAKLRQFYVVKQVEANWAAGAVKVTNHELRRFLEHQGRATKNGYQVTSYKAEFEKIFLGKVSASSTRNALSLSWNTA